MECFIIDAVRTPVGKRGGGLSRVHPADLAAIAIHEVVSRTNLDPGAVDDVILGCIDNLGPQSMDIARTAWLAAGLPEHVPGVTIDRQCGSSQQAVHFGAACIGSGLADLVVAGGVQSMSIVPMGSSMAIGHLFGHPSPFDRSSGWTARYGDEEISQFKGAEMMARRWNLSRAEMEQFALVSHQRARRAISEGRFDAEIVTVGEVTTDEGPRATSLEAMARLAPLRSDGRMTAALASQLSDGSAVLLLASERAIARHGLAPRARIHHSSCRGDDPVVMLSAPITATRHALDRAGMTIEDIDLFEVNEAFAPVVLAWLRELGADPDRVNVNGGALALGHAIGSTGSRLMTTLLHELERTGGRFGLQTMCEGGGQANVTIIERL